MGNPRPQSFRPPSAGRLLLSVALLVGFYALGLVVIAALLGVNWLLLSAGQIHFGLVIAAAVGIFGVVRGFFTSGSKFRGLPAAVEVSSVDQPALFREIRAIADHMQTSMPDRVFLVHDVNAFVLEDTRLLGLLTRQRVMGIGLPLLNALTVDELRGVIAHEFGHYAGNDTRLAPLVYRGRESILRTIGSVGGGVVASVYVSYFKLFLRVSMSVSRQQELAADEWAVRVAGSDPAVETQRRINALGSAHAEFVEQYVHGLWIRGHRPLNQFDGFQQMLADEGNQEAMASAVESSLARVADRFDSHPSASERIAFIRSLPIVPATGDNDRASSLLVDAGVCEAQVTDAYLAAAWSGGELQLVDWDDAGSVYGGSLREVSDDFNAASKSATAAEAVAAIVSSERPDRHRLQVAALASMAPGPHAEDALRFATGASIATALVDQGSHRWSVSWTHPAAVESCDEQSDVDVWALADGVAARDHEAIAAVSRLFSANEWTRQPAKN